MRSNRKGFTLAELLIVVAIIGVLVGVSIPIFTSQLEKSRQATDLANMRSAKSAALSEWMNNPELYYGTQYQRNYDAVRGVMTDEKPEGYGKSSKNVTEFASPMKGASGIPNPGSPTYITVTIDTDGTVAVVWASGNDLSTPEGRRKEDIDNMHDIAQALKDGAADGTISFPKNYAQVAVFADGTMAYYMDGTNSAANQQAIMKALENAGLSTDKMPVNSDDANWKYGYVIHIEKNGNVTYKPLNQYDDSSAGIQWNWWNKKNLTDADLVG